MRVFVGGIVINGDFYEIYVGKGVDIVICIVVLIGCYIVKMLEMFRVRFILVRNSESFENFVFLLLGI